MLCEGDFHLDNYLDYALIHINTNSYICNMNLTRIQNRFGQALVGFFLMVPLLAHARMSLDPADLEGSDSWIGIFLTIGLFGYLAVREHAELVQSYAPTVQGLIQWLFRFAIFFLLLSFLPSWFGLSVSTDIAFRPLVIWCIAIAAMGLYISGVAAGAKRR